MIEKIKAVNNPLTIIAIFAALAEIAGTVALATVDAELQKTFVWFVMGFPTALVALFFLTLNFNPKVLYAPSDFRDEANFINTLIGSRDLTSDLDIIAQQLESVKSTIVEQASKEVAAAGENEREKLLEVVNNQIGLLQSKIASTRESADRIAEIAGAFPRSDLQARIIEYLAAQEEPKSLKAIASHVGIGVGASLKALDRLVERGLLVDHDPRSDGFYELSSTPRGKRTKD